MSDIGRWLEELGLARYMPAFAENDIDEDVLPDLTEADLERLGVSSLGHRKRLLQAIAARAATLPPGADVDTERAERRQLTVMFADLVGSTALSARLDPEQLRSMMRTFQDCATAEIERYEGYIARYMGDGILAYFGYPMAHEDDGERAARAGLAIVEAVSALGHDSADSELASLSVRVGIETGQVVVGDIIGEGAAQENAVVGETPNIAARLQGLAAPGTVVVGPGTRRLLGEQFDCENLGDHAVRGLPGALPVWRLVGAREAMSRFASRRSTAGPDLVGRDEELDILRARWASASRGTGRTIVVTGEPGIGKSRLVETLAAGLEPGSVTRVSLQCSPFHRDSALHPFASELKHAAGVTSADAPEQQRDKLRAALGPLAAGADDRLDVLADLLAPGQGASSAIAALGPEQRRNLTQAALLRRLIDRAELAPVLVVFEDAHWIDPSSLEVLEQLVDSAAGLSMLVLVTARPEFEPPWTGQAGTMLLTLSRMQVEQSSALARQLAGEQLSPDLLQQIAARTDGVPLFVEELARAALDAQAGADGGREVEFPIPPTLHDLLIARLDQLQTGKRVAQMGAVLGRVFAHDVIARVAAQPDAELEEAIVELVDTGLVLRRRYPSGRSYEFKHALVQEVAYHSLLRAERRRLHSAIGVLLEEQIADENISEPEAIARHFTEAEQAERAIPYWRLAGEQAAARAAHLEAVAHLGRARELAREDALTSGRARDLIDIDVALAASLRIVGRVDDAFAALARAEHLSIAHGGIEDLARVHYQRGNLYYPRGEFEKTLTEHQRSLALSRDACSKEGEVRALGGLGDAYYSRGRMRSAHGHFDQCVELAREQGFDAIEIANLPMRGMTRVFLNRLVDSRTDFERAIERAASLGHLRAKMIAHIGVSRVISDQGHLDDAVEHLEQARQLADRLHSRAFVPAILATVCRMWDLLGRHEEALEMLEQADSLSKETGRRFAGARVLGAIVVLSDDPARRRDAIAEGEALLAAGSVGHNYYWFYRDAIESTLAAGEWEEATRHASALEAFARQEPVPWSDFFARRGWVLASVGRGDCDPSSAKTLEELAAEARRAGLNEPALALEQALASLGGA